MRRDGQLAGGRPGEAMRVIHKYELPFPEESFELELPEGYQILSIQVQKNRPVMWALVDSESPPFKRRFFLLATGQALPQYNAPYRGTVQLAGGDLVLHLFEGLP